jgi:hypothetical protein
VVLDLGGGSQVILKNVAFASFQAGWVLGG